MWAVVCYVLRICFNLCFIYSNPVRSARLNGKKDDDDKKDPKWIKPVVVESVDTASYKAATLVEPGELSGEKPVGGLKAPKMVKIGEIRKVGSLIKVHCIVEPYFTFS